MASREDNELLTRVGPGTGMGELIRRYWQPAALAEELPIGGAPLPVRLLGEDLGLILAFMGPGEPPLVPAHEFLMAPDAHRFATKLFQECNYLQGNEGNIDQAHVSFLHRRLEVNGDGESALTVRDTSPVLDPQETD